MSLTGAYSPQRPGTPGAFDGIMGMLGKSFGKLMPGEVGNDKQLLKDLDERFDRAKQDRKAVEPQMLLNLAMFMGQQWLQWDQAARTLQKPNVPAWRVLAVANYTRANVLQAFGRIVHNRPQAKAMPANDSPEAEEAARTQDQLLDYLWPTTHSKRAVDRVLLWALITGTGVLKPCWDAASGDVIGQNEQTGGPLHMGEVAVYPVSPFEFYPEPQAQEIEDMSWAFHTTLRPASWVRDRYTDPKTGKPVDLENENFQQTETFEAQLKNIINGGAQGTGQSKGVLVKEYYERPSTDFTEGRNIVYAQDRVLFQGPNPYKNVPLPFIPIRGEPVPGRFWGESFVTDMIDAQRNYNKSRSQAIEIRNLMSKPKWRVPAGALPVGKVITSAPGEMVTYTPVGAHKPEPVPGEPIPASFFQDQSSALREMYDISAQHPIGFGTTGVRSALAIAYLQEQDNTRLGPLSGEYQDGIEALERAKLLIAKQYYQEDRTIAVTGPDNRVEVMRFSAETIPADVQVRVQAGAALPMSRVARQQFILQLAQTSISPTALIKDPKVILKLLEFGEVEGLYDDVTQDERQAERENEVMKAGEPVEVKDFHNHAVHVHEHDGVRKSELYEQHTEIQGVFDQHVLAHKQAIAAAQLQAQLQAQQMQQSAGATSTAQAAGAGAEADLFGGGEEAGHPGHSVDHAGMVQTGPEAGTHDPYAAKIEQMVHQ